MATSNNKKDFTLHVKQVHVLDRYSAFRILLLLAITLFCIFALIFYFLKDPSIYYANIGAALALTWAYRFLPKPKLLNFEVNENQLRIIDDDHAKLSEISSGMAVDQLLKEQGLSFPILVSLEKENIPNKIFLNKVHAYLEKEDVDKVDYFNLIFKDGKFQLRITTSLRKADHITWNYLTTIERDPQITKQNS